MYQVITSKLEYLDIILTIKLEKKLDYVVKRTFQKMMFQAIIQDIS